MCYHIKFAVSSDPSSSLQRHASILKSLLQNTGVPFL